MQVRTLPQVAYPIQQSASSLRWSQESHFLSVFDVTADLSTELVTTHAQTSPTPNDGIKLPEGNRNSIRPLVSTTMQQFETFQVDEVQSSIYVSTPGQPGYKKVATVPLIGTLSLGWWLEGRELIVSGMRPDVATYQMLRVNLASGKFELLESNAYLVAAFSACRSKK